MVKPILTIGVNLLTEKTHAEIKESLSELFNDYHVIVYNIFSNDGVKFQVFYEKDMSEIELQELKELVINGIKK